MTGDRILIVEDDPYIFSLFHTDDISCFAKS